MFHPLITPLTTYMYTTDIQDNGTVSATDDERLPPGGFSLRHGFPEWFGRGRRSRVLSGGHQQQQQQQPNPLAQTPPRSSARGGGSLSNASTPGSHASPQGTPSFMRTRKKDVSTYEVLRYIRSTFDSEDVLDLVPLEAAGNPGAWHAWRTHQRTQGKKLPKDANGPLAPSPERRDDVRKDDTSSADGTMVRKPGQWNWDHVWEERVKKGIAASLSEPVLYGNAGASDDVVSFFGVFFFPFLWLSLPTYF